MFGQVLQITVPVFGVAAVGYLFGRLSKINMDVVNRVNMTLFVPALLFYILTEQIPDITALGSITLGALIVVLGSGLLALPIARLANIPPRALIPSMMFSNSGNLGLPLATLAFGVEHLPLSVIAFVVSAALNHSLGVWYVSGQNPKGLLRNPVFIATGVGLACNLLDWQIPRILLPGLEMLAQVAVPLLLVALGVRLTNIETEHWKLGVSAALLCPILGLLLAWMAIRLLNLDPYESQALILFGALPPAVMNFLMAERYGHFPHQVASIVAIGNLMALISIPLVLIYLLHNAPGV